MREHGLEGAFWPSERQKLLLRTAFAGGEASAEAWRQLRPRLDVDELEPGSLSVVPLVHRQLERLGLQESYVSRFAGLRRRTWYLNNVQLEALAPALRALGDAAGEFLVIGGWQFPAHYHGGDFGLRPVHGLAVLVRASDLAACARALAALGFQGPRAAGKGDMTFVRADGLSCTLSRRFAREFSVPERGIEPADLWEGTIEIPLGDSTARALAPTDELVRVLLEGARATTVTNLLWVADALGVLRGEAEPKAIDWERLVRHARTLRATLRVRDALVYLGRELDAGVPDDTIHELETAPVRRREYRAHREAGLSRRFVGPTPATVTRFLQVTADRALPAAVIGLPTFLRDEFGLSRRTQLPLEILRRAAARRREGRRPPQPSGTRAGPPTAEL